jgi:hypothetical protein
VRLPWVSRDRYDALERTNARLDENYEYAESAAIRAEAEVKRLTDIIVDLKREGYNPSPRETPAQSLPELPDTIMSAIHKRAQPNSQLYRELVGWARSALSPDGGNSEDVATMVYRGADTEEDE